MLKFEKKKSIKAFWGFLIFAFFCFMERLQNPELEMLLSRNQVNQDHREEPASVELTCPTRVFLREAPQHASPSSSAQWGRGEGS